MATIAENLQTIKDSTEAIKQAIIDKGVTISGGLTTYADAIKNISGGGEGGSTSGAVSKSDVNFYDYDGTLLYSYTKSTFLALSVLPNLPTREGLICQEWNYNLSKAKEYVGEYGILDIGATYITDDGKTRLYISIATDGRMDVPLYFSQTVSNGVTIDWGDGTSPQSISGTGNVSTTHKYNEIGDYIITLNPKSGCTLGLGYNSSTYCVMGSTRDNNAAYRSMLQRAEIGNSVTSVGASAFSYCYSLSSIVIPNSVTSVGASAFSYCSGVAYYDFSKHTTIPTSENNEFSSIPSDCKIIVPDSLYDSWKSATNWSSYASYIIKKSDWDAIKVGSSFGGSED